MFPYVERPVLEIGGATFHAFGLCVGLAVLLGSWITLRRAGQQGVERASSTNLLLCTLLCGFLLSHLETLAFARPDLFLRPASLLEEPLAWLNLWKGMSSFGGILGGVLGAAWYMRRHRWTHAERWAFLDSLAYAFPFAWAVARFGCFLAHDHPGIHTTSWLAVAYPDGPRYDLGLFDCFLALAIGAAFLILDRRAAERPPAFFLLTFLLAYSPARLVLDLLRDEERFLGLTTGQLGALVSIAISLLLLRHLRRGAWATSGNAARNLVVFPGRGPSEAGMAR